MRISYGITVCNEFEELQTLLNFIQAHKREIDEIVVLVDVSNTTDEILDYLKNNNYNTIEAELNNDFATFKNNLLNHCQGTYIIQLDADEIPSVEFMESIHLGLEESENNGVDVIFVPRYNHVIGITNEWIDKWGWNINPGKLTTSKKENITDGYYQVLEKYELIASENEDDITYFEPMNNWPDFQGRILMNNGVIHWKEKVHERLDGFNRGAHTPSHMYLNHIKTLEKQIQQNDKYENIFPVV